MTRRERFFYTLKVLITPSCWLQNHSYLAVWDKRLIELMKEHEFKIISAYEAKLGNVVMWVANNPYASFVLGDCRPKRSTILFAQDKFVKDVTKNIINSKQIEAKPGNMGFDGESYIINVVAKNMENYGVLHHKVASIAKDSNEKEGEL